MEQRVTSKQAARELQIDVLTLRELMKQEKIPIGYALKKDGKERYHFYIYRALLDEYKKRLGII